MAKRFYDTGLPDQNWYQKLSTKRKALYIHLLCRCDVAGVFEINLPLMSAYIGEEITEADVFGFGNRVVPLMNGKDKAILVDFVYFQCGGEINPAVKAHQSVLKRLSELNMTVQDLASMCTHELKYKELTEPKGVREEVYSCSLPIKINPIKINPVESRVKPNKVKASSNEVMDMFNQFYSAYPRHDSKQCAILSFGKIMNNCKTDEERKSLLGRMLEAIKRERKSEQWTKNNGKFIPMPSTWLNQRRWEDEGVVVCNSTENTSKLAKALSGALSI